MWTENKRPLTAGFGTIALAFFDVDGDALPDVEIFTVTANPIMGQYFNRCGNFNIPY